MPITPWNEMYTFRWCMSLVGRSKGHGSWIRRAQVFVRGRVLP